MLVTRLLRTVPVLALSAALFPLAGAAPVLSSVASALPGLRGRDARRHRGAGEARREDPGAGRLPGVGLGPAAGQGADGVERRRAASR